MTESSDLGLYDEMFDDDVPLRTIDEEITHLIRRAGEAQDTCGWAAVETRDGRLQLAAGAIELARVMKETLALIRSIRQES